MQIQYCVAECVALLKSQLFVFPGRNNANDVGEYGDPLASPQKPGGDQHYQGLLGSVTNTTTTEKENPSHLRLSVSAVAHQRHSAPLLMMVPRQKNLKNFHFYVHEIFLL